MRQAVILAGGFGTRLSHIVSDVPKPLAPIEEIPFLEYVVKALKKQSFDNFVFLTGYKAEQIEKQFNQLENAVFIKEEKALGTGGAILNAFDKLQDEFFVINGDTFFDIDYDILEKFGKNKPITLALRYTNNIERYGFVEIDDNFKITSFVEKSSLPKDRIDGYINGGIYYVRKSALKPYAEKFNGEFISLETEIFPKLLNNNQLYGLPIGGCFIDIGIPEDYYRAQDLIPDWISKESKPALFVDKDGTLIENTEYPHGKDFKIIENTVDIVKQYAALDYHIIMITNQAGIGKGKFTKEEMQEGFEGIREYYGKKYVEFHDIEYCPYHKDSVIKEYAYDTILRKPNPGMILTACEKLKIDLSRSIMVGDNPDIDNIKLPYLNCKIVKEGEHQWI
ncbi:HAD-IIIA family hydrolase [bacterium]|nr:HAD-IIIA family hydrolase [bacterium]